MDAVMPNPALPGLRVAVMAMGLLMLLGCTAPPPEPAPKVLTADEAAARTVVPLTRPIALDKAGQVVDLEFELPPVAQGEVPVLILGLRVWGDDGRAVIAQQERIDAIPLATRIHLQRVATGDTADVPLSYTSRDRRSELAVGPDGDVPFTTESSVATGALWNAGLVDGRRVYGVLRIAEASGLKAGRFRLRIALPADRPDLHGLDVELLLAYGLRAK